MPPTPARIPSMWLLALALLSGLGEFVALQAWRLRDRMRSGPAAGTR